MGALPKQRISHARQGERRAHHHLELPQLVACPNCKRPRRAHLRERVAELPHQEGPHAGIDQCGQGSGAGAAEDRGEGGGHLRE